MIVSDSEKQGLYGARADVCIIGTGPAGMSLALSLVQQGHRVFLVEAGGMDYDPESQAAYQGEVIGDEYYALDASRLRYFGGTSNHWAGWCRPLTPGDFEAHPSRDVAWPIEAADLAVYNDAASEILEIAPGFETTSLSDDLTHGFFRISQVNFGIKYRDFCETNERVGLFLDSMLTDFVFEDGHVRRAVVTRGDGGTFELEADYFVLCTGGIENSRLLKYIDGKNGSRLKSADVIGRYWMEHPHTDLGEAIVFDKKGLSLFGDPRELCVLYLSDAARQRMNLLNAGLLVAPTNYADGWKSRVADLLCVAPALGERVMALASKDLVCGSWLRSEYEQAPIAENRVALADEVDRFGVPRPVLYWRRTEEDRLTILENTKAIAAEFARLDLGRFRMADWIVEDGPLPSTNRNGGWHHMGGTRMGTSPTDSVVDASLKVHDLDNLYIAGSSVFPTGGYANPTYTIVRLSLRMADHLSARLS